MRAIINQKPDLPRLPELRNLGTVLRILLAVNGLALSRYSFGSRVGKRLRG
jgi:hypothetical protein